MSSEERHFISRILLTIKTVQPMQSFQRNVNGKDICPFNTRSSPDE